jgi:hypothetical protein
LGDSISTNKKLGMVVHASHPKSAGTSWIAVQASPGIKARSYLRNNQSGLMPVTHTCSYLGGSDPKDQGSKPAQENCSQSPISRNTQHKPKHGRRSGSSGVECLLASVRPRIQTSGLPKKNVTQPMHCAVSNRRWRHELSVV